MGGVCQRRTRPQPSVAPGLPSGVQQARWQLEQQLSAFLRRRPAEVRACLEANVHLEAEHNETRLWLARQAALSARAFAHALAAVDAERDTADVRRWQHGLGML